MTSALLHHRRSLASVMVAFVTAQDEAVRHLTTTLVASWVVQEASPGDDGRAVAALVAFWGSVAAQRGRPEGKGGEHDGVGWRRKPEGAGARGGGSLVAGLLEVAEATILERWRKHFFGKEGGGISGDGGGDGDGGGTIEGTWVALTAGGGLGLALEKAYGVAGRWRHGGGEGSGHVDGGGTAGELAGPDGIATAERSMIAHGGGNHPRWMMIKIAGEALNLGQVI